LDYSFKIADICNNTEYNNKFREHDHISLLSNKNTSMVTYDELLFFLESDNSDQHHYETDVYDCTQFAENVCNNATRAGILNYYVVIVTNDVYAGHTASLFPTTDKEWILVDNTPSTDGHVITPKDCIITRMISGQKLEKTNINKNLYYDMDEVKHVSIVKPDTSHPYIDFLISDLIV
jgi:hypothetical protein